MIHSELACHAAQQTLAKFNKVATSLSKESGAKVYALFLGCIEKSRDPVARRAPIFLPSDGASVRFARHITKPVPNATAPLEELTQGERPKAV
jgi:hypothetical protein